MFCILGRLHTWNYKLICKFHDFSMEIPVSSVATVSDVLTGMFMDIAGSLNFQDVEEKKTQYEQPEDVRSMVVCSERSSIVVWSWGQWSDSRSVRVCKGLTNAEYFFYTQTYVNFWFLHRHIIKQFINH